MAIIFKPRRSIRSKISSGGTKASLVLQEGEIFFSKDDTAGSTARYNVYFGDGSTQIQNLSPALFGDTSEEDITLTADASTTSSAALANITSGKTLGSLLGSVKTAITNANKEAKNIYYGTCATAAGTKNKVATIPAAQNFILQVGTMVAIKFSNTNSYSATSSNHITLNVNSTGALDIWYSNTNATTGTQTAAFGIANNYHYYMYDGTYWVFAGRSQDGDSGNTNLRLNAAINAGTDAIVKANIICANSSNLYYHLKKGTAFDIRWPILYAADNIAANGTGTNNYVMVNVAIATTQSLTLTAYKPLYIKGTLSGTTFTPVSTTPITQTEPTTVDGYYYLYLGVAYNTTNFYLLDYHPIYVYTLSGFKIYDQSFAVNKRIQDVDLNTIKEPGFYYAGGNNGCSNLPTSFNVTQANGFGLVVIITANTNYLVQIYSATSNNMLSRVCSNGTWGNWMRFNGRVYQSVTTHTNWRKVALSAQNNESPEADVVTSQEQVYLTPKVEVQASTGTLRSQVLTSKTSVNIGNGAASMQYNSNTQSIDFVFPS